MLYIITGIAKAGKSYLANEIKERYQISSFSTDYIMMMLSRANKNLNIDVDASDITVSKQLEPYIYFLVKTMIENDETYLFEGVHFTAEFSRKLLDEFKDDLKIIYIGYKDITTKQKVDELNKFQESMNNPWIFNHLNQPIEEIVEYLIEESSKLFNDCNKYNLTYIDIFNIENQAENIILNLLKIKK